MHLVDEVHAETVQDEAAKDEIGKGSLAADVALVRLHHFSSDSIDGLRSRLLRTRACSWRWSF